MDCRRRTPSRARDQVAALIRAHAFRLEVVERGAHDGERGAQFVRELPAQGAKVLSVLVQAREKPLEAARQRADLIAARRLRHLEPDAPVVPHRGLGRGAQPAEPHADHGGDAEGEGHGERRGEQREIE